MISNKSNVDMIFMQYKTTTCLSIDEVLKKNKEIPTSNGETQRRKKRELESAPNPNFLGSKRRPRQTPPFLQKN